MDSGHPARVNSLLHLCRMLQEKQHSKKRPIYLLNSGFYYLNISLLLKTRRLSCFTFVVGISALTSVIFYHIPNLCLQHDAATGILLLEWVALSNPHQLRASAQQLLELLQQLEVRHLLLDMNSLPDLLLADQKWLGDYWMPGLVALALERLVLVIDSDRVHNQLAVDALHDLVQPAIRFSSHYFADVALALDWLTDGSERLPALAAEWATRHSA